MISKKLVFSAMTIPLAIMCHNSSEWQGRRKNEKTNEIERRTKRLNEEAQDLTPVDGKFAFNGMTPEEIEEKFGFRRVKIKGLMDFDNEVRVDTVYKGEKGQIICTPLYTHVNENKEACGIMVNRGFLTKDFDTFQKHRFADSNGYFEGIIYTGDKMSKYDMAPNTPISNSWSKVIPYDLALHSHLKNREDSGVAMLMLVEFDENMQQPQPSAPTVNELMKWKNMPERHTAYQVFWKYATYLNLFANTMFWLYF